MVILRVMLTVVYKLYTSILNIEIVSLTQVYRRYTALVAQFSNYSPSF